MSGLMMFSEIGKLRARKKIPLLEPESVLKDYDVHSVTFWLTKFVQEVLKVESSVRGM